MKRIALMSLLFLATLSSSAFAHKVWLRPSQTSLSGEEPWVTVDAAVSNDLFYFNHFPLGLDNLVIIAPDGSKVEAENPATGKYRSVFDLQLKQEGTYRIAIVNDGMFASWEQDGQPRRWRGSAEAFAAEVPADAKGLRVSESVGRIETFVTNGAPSKTALKTTGKGIELVPVTHPNDLYAGETGKFQFLVDGEPAANLEVEIICGGTRYRNSQESIKVTTDASGRFEVKWPEAGMFWISTSSSDDKTTISKAGNRRLSYAATVEVLPQ